MLKIKQRGKRGTWWITGTFNGQRVRESTGTDSKDHAEIQRAKRERELLDRKYLGPEKTSTFAEAVVLYLEAGGEARFVHPLLDWFGVYRLRDISQSEIVRFAASIYPGIGAPGLNRQVFTPMNAILRFAAKAGMCEMPALTRPKQVKKAVEHASDEWLAAFLDAAASNASLVAIVLFMTTTGTRVGEACRLRWDDVDVERGEAILPRTKNGSARRVVLVPVAQDAIRRLIRNAAPVFGYASRFSVNQAIERVCERVGLPYMSSHKLGRHAFAARLLKAGHTLKVVAEAGGWKSLRLAGETYGHLERSTVDNAVLTSNADMALPEARKTMRGKVVKLLPAPHPEVPQGRHGLYVLSSGGYYKVGITQDLRARITALRSASPLKIAFHHLEVFMTADHARDAERRIHDDLDDFRVEGEWFACPLERVMASVALACAQEVSEQIGTTIAL